LTSRSAGILFVLVLVLRVSIAAQFRGSFDSRSYLIVAQATLEGQNVYQTTSRYNYSPVWSWVVALLWLVARPNFGLFVLLVGLLQTAADAGTAYVVFRIARDRLGQHESEARRASLLFFSNPISIAVSCGHGQFDGLSILFLVLAVWLAGEDAYANRRGVVASLSLSLLCKHVTLFHPVLFSRRVRRGGLPDGWVLLPYIVFAASFLPYAAALPAIFENVLVYATYLHVPVGPYPGGLQWLIEPRAPVPLLFNGLLAGAVVWAVIATRRQSLARSCLILFLVLIAFMPTYSIQSLVWPVALGSLWAGPAYALFSGLAALTHTSLSLGLSWPIVVRPLAPWVAAVVWLAVEARMLASKHDRAGDTPRL
jgi:hypothetical protein